MMREDTGSPIRKVIGKSIAIVAVAPMPGSTPISVPSSRPIRQKSRFHKVDAVEKPRRRLSKSSMPSSSEHKPGAEAPEWQTQSPGEHDIGEERHADGQDQGGERLHAQAGKGCKEGTQENSGKKAHAPHCQ